jgi:DNA-binding XRE family transcriptional regulator
VSQAQLAQAAGIPPGAIANVEADRYLLSARNGVQIFAALSRMATAGSELQRQAEQCARELAAKQDELFRKSLIAAERQFESAKKKIKELHDMDAEIKLAISRLGKG